MRQQQQLLEKITLENGLELNIYDGCRTIAGDRWFVSVTARIEIPVDEDEFRSALGDHVVFEKKMERNFISQDEKPKLLAEISSSLVGAISKYLALPDFPRKYVLRCFHAHQQKQGWYKS